MDGPLFLVFKHVAVTSLVTKLHVFWIVEVSHDLGRAPHVLGGLRPNQVHLRLFTPVGFVPLGLYYVPVPLGYVR